MTSLSVFKWEIFQGKKNSRKQNHRTWIIKYPTKRAGRLVRTIFHEIPRALIMHVRWNMIYWLTKKEISKNSPAFLGYNHFPFVKNNWKVRQVFASGSTYFLKPLKNTRFDFFFSLNDTIQKNPSMQCFLVRVTKSDYMRCLCNSFERYYQILLKTQGSS